MLKFQIIDETVEEINGTSQRGRAYQLRVQRARVAIKDEIRSVRVLLDRDQKAYPKGDYGLLDTSFSVGQYGDLEVRPVLAPLKAGA